MTRRTANGRPVTVLQNRTPGKTAPEFVNRAPIPPQQAMKRMPQPVINLGLGLKLNP
jgi:hypothetical protein